MSEKKPRYITTTLPYVNADPHIGFAYELLVGDALARYWRLMGHEVFFNTGTDEHGQKIAEKADEEGTPRQEYIDHYASKFARLKESLNLSFDNFIRTSDSGHQVAAQSIWQKCEAKGDIYKKSYKGLYCVGDEMFLRDSDLVDGRCPNHPNVDPVEIEEENYLKSSGLSGDQVRKKCSIKVFCDGIQILDETHRSYEHGYRIAHQFIIDMEMHWSWFPKKVDEEIGKIVGYREQLCKIKRVIIEQACLILETAGFSNLINVTGGMLAWQERIKD